MFDFVKVISANNGCIFSFFVTFGKYFLSVYGIKKHMLLCGKGALHKNPCKEIF